MTTTTDTTATTTRSRTSTAPRRRPELTVEEKTERRVQKLTEVHDRLADAVAAAASNPGWRAWLTTAGKFRTYSANNVLLIAAQAPEATRVAGYRVWQGLNRQVRRGERGIVILAPIRRRDPAADTDSAAADGPDQTTTAPGSPAAAAESGDQAGRGPRVLAGFTTATVFDVSQTDGDPLPDYPQVELPVGEAPAGLWDALTAQVTARGYTVTCEDPAPAYGVTRYRDRRVDIAPGLSAAMACHTLAHELGHITADHEHRRDLTRGVREAEADGIAYLVGTAYGLPAEFTVDYVTGWTNGDPAVIRSTAARVVTHAAQLLGALGHTHPDHADPGEDTTAGG